MIYYVLIAKLGLKAYDLRASISDYLVSSHYYLCEEIEEMLLFLCYFFSPRGILMLKRFDLL